MAKFAQQFARRIQGLLIEGKWNKKFIGLKGEDPTDDENLSIISSVKAKKSVRWISTTPEVESSAPSFSINPPKLRPEKMVDFYKIMISGPSAHFIAQNTFKLSANLLQVANLGSINDGQSEVIQVALEIIFRDLEQETQDLGPEDAIATVNAGLDKFSSLLDEFQEIGIKFTMEGRKGSLQDVLAECAQFFDAQPVTDNILIRKILEIFLALCEQETAGVLQSQIRSSDLKADLNFFVESSKSALDLVHKHLYRYFSLLINREIKDQLVTAIQEMLSTEDKPSLALGTKFLEKINKILDGEIAYEHFFHVTNKQVPFDQLAENFVAGVRENLSKYFEEVDVNIADLLAFAESMMDDDTELDPKNTSNNSQVSSDKLSLFMHTSSGILQSTALLMNLKQNSPTLIHLRKNSMNFCASA